MDYWRVVEVTGDVEVLPGPNPWNSAIVLVSGTAVGPFQSIATGSDGRAILVRGEDIIVVYEESVVELPPPSARAADTMILQRDGTVYYDVDPRVVPNFAVETPFLLVGVKGTKFVLTDGGATLVVVEGLVGAADSVSGAEQDVSRAEAVTATAGTGGSFVARPADPALLAIFTAMAAYVDANRSLWAGLVQEAAIDEGMLPASPTGGADGSASSSLGGAVDSAAGTIDEMVSGVTGGLAETVGGATSGLGGAVSGAGEAVGGTVGGAASGAGDAVGGAVSGAGEAVGGAIGGAGQAVGGLLGGQ